VRCSAGYARVHWAAAPVDPSGGRSGGQAESKQSAAETKSAPRPQQPQQPTTLSTQRSKREQRRALHTTAFSGAATSSVSFSRVPGPCFIVIHELLCAFG
jgi:hypothetical protein